MIMNHKIIEINWSHSMDEEGFCSMIVKSSYCGYATLLWQKEATHKSPKSDKVMFLDWP